jgi:miniconductance mechanosensitive channel
MIFIARRTKTKFDDLLVTNKTLNTFNPLLFIYKSVPVILQHEYWEGLLEISWSLYCYFGAG